VIEEMEGKNIPPDLVEPTRAFMDGSAVLKYSQELSQLKDLIINFGVSDSNIVIDPTIARGLDYYTGTVFEIYLNDKPEFGSICSGGRYDNLVDQFSSQPLSAVGGSIGIDRLLAAKEEMGEMERKGKVKALILNLEDAYLQQYAALASKLRSQGINVEVYYSAAKLDKQFKYAESKKIEYGIILGEAEIARGIVQLKNLSERKQEEISADELPGRLKD
jgi:histidyl-tRNA synthetase